MTRKEKRNGLKNGAKRKQTPRDKEVAGTFADTVPRAPKVCRRRTKAEMQADDRAPVAFARGLSDIAIWIPLFRSELEFMNRSKVGRPFQFCDSMIAWIMARMAAYGMTFRDASGDAGGILAPFGLKAPSHSRLVERVLEMSGRDVVNETTLKYGEGFIVVKGCSNVVERTRDVAADSTGLNLSSELCWRRKKWGTGPEDRGWLKLHLLADVDSGEIIAYVLTDQSVGDCPVMKVLLDAAQEEGHKIGRIYGDNAYCSDENWADISRERGMEFVTCFRSNTTPTSNGCMERGAAAELWCRLRYSEWKEVTGYGRRWKIECVNSDLKRKFGETVTASTLTGAVAEVCARVGALNVYKAMRARIMGVTGNDVVIG